MKKDNLHFNFRYVDSFNATYNFIMSERTAGKSVAIFTKLEKIHRKHHRTAIVIRNKIVDITETYISSIEESINKFRDKDHKIKLKYKRGNIKEGIVDIFIDGRNDEIPFLRIIALSNPISRLKSFVLRAPACIVWDEYILNTRDGEKYEPNTVLKFKEIYNTYFRETVDENQIPKWSFKCYFLGNPYSRFHPMHSEVGMDYSKLKPGYFEHNGKRDYVVWCYTIKPELKEAILKANPLYNFDADDIYTKYAFGGESINDTNFTLIAKQPEHYYLRFIFRINNKYLCIYQDNRAPADRVGYDTGRYWISVSNSINTNRRIYAVDFNQLVEGTQFITSDVKAICWRLKNSIGSRSVTYQSIEAGYLTEAIYQYIN